MITKSITQKTALSFLVVSILLLATPITTHAAWILTYRAGGQDNTESFPTQDSCEQKKGQLLSSGGVKAANCASDGSGQATGFFCYQANSGQNIQKTCFPANQQQQCEQNRISNAASLDNGCSYSTTDISGTISIPGSGTPGQYQLLAPLPANNPSGQVPTDLVGYIKGMYQLAISLAAVLAVFMVTYGGILYMSTDAYSQKSEGKEIIKQSLWGLTLLIASFLILSTINPKILDISAVLTDNLPPPPATQITSKCQSFDTRPTIPAGQAMLIETFPQPGCSVTIYNKFTLMSNMDACRIAAAKSTANTWCTEAAATINHSCLVVEKKIAGWFGREIKTNEEKCYPGTSPAEAQSACTTAQGYYSSGKYNDPNNSTTYTVVTACSAKD